MAPTILRLAVCLYPGVTTLDYVGPMELIGGLTPEGIKGLQTIPGMPVLDPSHLFSIQYLSHSLDPVVVSGPKLMPDGTYESATKQFDIIVIPGGLPGKNVDKSLLDFIVRQEPGLKHILTICTGSWILAVTGLLDGKKATTNKAMFNLIKEDTKDRNIDWVAKARWVVHNDKKIWTSSGVTAGQDLGRAFLLYLVGEEATKIICGITELSHREQGEDEWAAYWGAV